MPNPLSGVTFKSYYVIIAPQYSRRIFLMLSWNTWVMGCVQDVARFDFYAALQSFREGPLGGGKRKSTSTGPSTTARSI